MNIIIKNTYYWNKLRLIDKSLSLLFGLGKNRQKEKQLWNNLLDRMMSSCSCFFLFIFLISTITSFAQENIIISGQLKNNTRFTKIVVQKFGIGVYDIVSIGVDNETGNFNIIAPADVEPGIYRFRYSQIGYGDFVDVIINGLEKQISFSIDVSQALEDRIPQFSSSEENIAWYSYLKKLNHLSLEIQVNEEFLINYPTKKGKVYKSILKEFKESKKEYLDERREFINNTGFYWAKNMANYTNDFFPQINDHPLLQKYNAHSAFWNNKPTTDPKLLNTPLYTDAIFQYLQYYMNPEMEFSEDEQYQGLVKCIDAIMHLFSGNQETNEFALKYLQIGFKELGNEKILQYIDENYKDLIAQCQDDSEKAAFEKRLEGYKAIKPGVLAPNIEFKNLIHNPTNDALDLYGIQASQTIVVFWASWCPHCMEVMPKINEWAQNNPNTAVIAISLDVDPVAYKSAIRNFTNLSHSCDFEQWDGKAATDYFVYSTPSFYVLDKDKKIISKLTSFEKLEELNK